MILRVQNTPELYFGFQKLLPWYQLAFTATPKYSKSQN